MTQTPEGWYPVDGGQERYWDGSAWTDQSRPAQSPHGAPPPPAYQPSYQQPPKKKHTLRNVLLVLIVLFILVVGGCLALVGGAAKSISDKESKGHDVTYVVSGTAKKADLTYTTDGSTSMEQIQGAKVPWKKKLHIKGDLLNVYQLTAQNKGGGAISCEILVDGKSVKKGTSRGQYAIATCDYVNK